MATYDLRCKKCGHEWEHSQGMNDPNPPCPHVREQLESVGGTGEKFPDVCGGETEKVYRKAVAAHFVGGGWAADNYSSTKK